MVAFLGKKRAGQFEQGMEALSQMDRIKQVYSIYIRGGGGYF